MLVPVSLESGKRVYIYGGVYNGIGKIVFLFQLSGISENQ